MFQPCLLFVILAWQVPAPPHSGATPPLQSAPSSLGGSQNLRCGAESLYFGLKWLDLPVADFPQVEAKLGPPSNLGYSMSQLESAAQSFGAQTLGVETTLENLARRPEPLVRIAYLNSKHFVTILGESNGLVEIINPPAREIQIPRATFLQLWDGKALLLSTNPILKEEDLAGPFPWRLIIGVAIGAILSLVIFFWLSFKKPKHG